MSKMIRTTDKKMILGVCGYGYTGSGAVFDLMKEFQDCEIRMEEEFALTYIPHGIQNLEYHLTAQYTRFFSSDVAIKEFIKLINYYNTPRGYYRKHTNGQFRRIAEEFLDEIIQIKWRGYSWDDSILADPIYKTVRFRILGRWMHFREKYFATPCSLPKGDVMYLSVELEDFVDKAKTYLHHLLESIGYDFDRIIVLNQPFDVNNPRRSMKYFDDSKMIIVDRDPRDIYVLAKKCLGSEGSFIPTEKVEDYITYHRLIRKSSCDKDAEDILHIRFEDLIYHYKDTVRKIMGFLNLSDSGWEQRKYFDPARSINNTQLFLAYPELADEIREIEEKLPEYLYPFRKVSLKPDHKSKPF